MFKLLFPFIFISTQIVGQTVLKIDNQFSEAVVGKYCKYAVSAKNKFSFEQITKDSNIVFKTQQNDLLYFNEEDYEEDIWVQFKMVSLLPFSQKYIFELNNPLIDEVSFYHQSGNQLLDSNISGDVLPFNSRSILYRNPIYEITLMPFDTQTIYLKVNAQGRKIHLPLTLKTTKKFIEDSQTKNLVLGIYYGVLILLTVLYFYLSYALNDKVFLLFAIYMLFLTLSLLCTSGVLFQFLWPNYPDWNNRSITFFMTLTVMASLLFGREFISKKYQTQALNNVLFVAICFTLLVALSSLGNSFFLSFSMYILYRLIPLVYLFLFLLGSYFLIIKFKSARFLMVGFITAVIILGGIISLTNGKIADNVFTNYFVIYAVLLKCFLLSIAMLDRLKIFKENKENIQALQIIQLEELNDYKELLNKQLEFKVEQKGKELFEKQNEVKRALLFGEENERKRVAKELHDGLGSLLSTLKLNAESINLGEQDLNEKESIAYQNLLAMIDQACTELRSISHNIIPIELEHFGLSATVRSLINKVNQNASTNFMFNVLNMEQVFDKETELNVYRILLELINNIIKHSQAKTATIQMIRQDNYVSIIIEDDGVGFDKSNINLKGIGLQNISSRIQALEGELNIDSVNGKGTTVIIEIPIK